MNGPTRQKPAGYIHVLPQERRQLIVEAAKSLLREQAAGVLRLRDVAVRADVSHQTIYNLIGNTDQLLAAVLDDYVRQTSDEVRASSVVADLDDPVSTTVALAEAMAEVALRDPQPLRAVLCEIGPLNLSQNKTAGLEVPLEQILTSSGLLPATAEQTARLIVYAFRGLLLSWAHELVPNEAFTAEAALISRTIAGAAIREHASRVR